MLLFILLKLKKEKTVSLSLFLIIFFKCNYALKLNIPFVRVISIFNDLTPTECL